MLKALFRRCNEPVEKMLDERAWLNVAGKDINV